MSRRVEGPEARSSAALELLKYGYQYLRAGEHLSSLVTKQKDHHLIHEMFTVLTYVQDALVNGTTREYLIGPEGKWTKATESCLKQARKIDHNCWGICKS